MVQHVFHVLLQVQLVHLDVIKEVIILLVNHVLNAQLELLNALLLIKLLLVL